MPEYLGGYGGQTTLNLEQVLAWLADTIINVDTAVATKTTLDPKAEAQGYIASLVNTKKPLPDAESLMAWVKLHLHEFYRKHPHYGWSDMRKDILVGIKIGLQYGS